MPTTSTVAEDCDKMLDNKLAASAGDPDEYSEGSSNPDDDWDGVDAVDGDDSKVVLPMNDSTEPGSAGSKGSLDVTRSTCSVLHG